MKITKAPRTFVSENLNVDSWSVLEPYYEDLVNRQLDTKENLIHWLKDQSELEAVLEEDAAWRYIRMTIDTRDEKLKERYMFFVQEIQPNLAPFADKLNRKLIECPFTAELESDDAYRIMLRSVRTALELYREENIPIMSELSEEAQKFGAISAAQTIEYQDKTLTMQQASLHLKNTDETIRKEVYDLIINRRSEDIKSLDELFDTLIEKRHQVAINAGFKNFRDYKLRSMGRFDYGVEECEAFHQSVKDFIVPIVKEIQREKLNKLGKPQFKPWDLDVDPEGKEPLKPFSTGKELHTGTVRMFEKVDPYFADCLETMDDMGHLDLESKEGKSPGGYNYPLYEIGVPFIFMNAVGAHRDLVTMVHEGGHAVHSFLSRDLELTGFKSLPSEVAELASMSMEMLTMDYWGDFYSNEQDLARAKKEQLQTTIKLLPWIAQIDEFQHWIYVNHDHSSKERQEKWKSLSNEYGTGLVDISGYEEAFHNSWQRQLHLFEVPFYYIEYGIAQLGALGVWKNSLTDKTSAIEAYKSALKLGYTRSIPEIYKEAGIEFNFSGEYIQELATFIQEKLNELK